jgi:hypothetical protein
VGPARQREREGMARGVAGLRETGRGAAHAEEKRGKGSWAKSLGCLLLFPFLSFPFLFYTQFIQTNII